MTWSNITFMFLNTNIKKIGTRTNGVSGSTIKWKKNHCNSSRLFPPIIAQMFTTLESWYRWGKSFGWDKKKTAFDLLETCVTLYLSLFYNLFWNGFISQDTAVSYELITRRVWLQWLKSTIKTFTFGILISGLMPRWAIQSFFMVHLSPIFCRFGVVQYQDGPKRTP